MLCKTCSCADKVLLGKELTTIEWGRSSNKSTTLIIITQWVSLRKTSWNVFQVMWKDWHLVTVEESPCNSFLCGWEKFALLQRQLKYSLNVIIGWNKVNKHVSLALLSLSCWLSLTVPVLLLKPRSICKEKQILKHASILAWLLLKFQLSHFEVVSQFPQLSRFGNLIFSLEIQTRQSTFKVQ